MKKILIFMALLLNACGINDKIKTQDNIAPKYGGKFIYAESGFVVGLDPILIKETGSIPVVSNIYDGLVNQSAGKTGIDPGIARSWQISKDGLLYTFHLRTNVQFHDGTQCNAAAVVFNFERQRNKRHPNYNPNNISWKSLKMDKIISDIRAINDSTVEFKLNKPDATFLSLLSHTMCFIASPKAITQYGNEFYKHPVGSGPFQFVSWDSVNGISIMTSFDRYWNGRPYIDTLVVQSILDSKKSWEALKAGQVDMMESPTEDDLEESVKTPGMKHLKQLGVNVMYMAFNCEKKPFTDQRVREAIIYAIDREKFANKIFGNFGRLAKNPIPPMLIGYNDNIRLTPFDPAKSKELLASAGFPNGFKTQLWTMPNSIMQKASILLQNDLRNVGIEIDIINPGWEDYLNQTYSGKHTIAFGAWIADIPDPDNFFTPLLDYTGTQPSENMAYYSSKEMHQLIEKGRTTTDPLIRSDVYKKACKIFNRDLPWFTMAHTFTIVVMKEKVMDFHVHSTSIRRFDKLWLNI
ncbi:ABC transporter substrate-binding protein [bacterium]|nr:ABC transporter substrate-binding protein [bacterium]